MICTTIVEKNTTGLEEITNAAERFDRESYLQAISSCKMGKEKVIALIGDVDVAISRLDKEFLALVNFASTFNSCYATDNNKCFDTSMKLFRKMRSTIKNTVKIFKQHCVKIMKRHARLPEERRPSVFDYSLIGKRTYYGDLFNYHSYDACVEELYEKLDTFFKKLVSCLLLCHRVLQEENFIRKNPSECQKIYEEDYNKVVEEFQSITKMLGGNAFLEVQGPTLNVYEDFHKPTKEEFRKHVFQDLQRKSKETGLSGIELRLWGQDKHKVMQIRYVIAHFDELNPEGHEGKLSGYAIAAFAEWCGISSDLKCFVEEYFNIHYHGKYQNIQYNSVTTARGKLDKQKKFKKEDFFRKIDSFLLKMRKEAS